MIRNAIHAGLKEELISLGAPDVAFVVERPADLSHGDYATNAALLAGKILKRNPREVAEEIVKKIENNIDSVEKVEVAGAGFINFFLTREALMQEVMDAATTERWGKNQAYANKVVMVEYTDPNPFKEFHIGHLMSNAIGESIARLLEHSGAEVVRANYQGDVGPHVAKAIWAMTKGVEKEQMSEIPKTENIKELINYLGRAYTLGALEYVSSENMKLASAGDSKKEIDDINKKIYEKSNPEINRIYDWGRKLSLEHFEELYKILGTKFDKYFFESETGPKGLEIVKSNPEIFEHSDGAIIFRGENVGLHTRVFVNKLGLPTYEAKDLGLAELKKEKVPFDTSITITAQEQQEYFKVVLAALFKIHPNWSDQFVHRTHGMMRFAEGKMSSRKGNVITGESLLMDLTDEAKTKMDGRNLANVDEVAQQVAVGAIKYTVLKQGSGKDIVFDPEKSLSLEGDSGPYLQYAHTRALSLVKAAQKENINPDSTDAPTEPTALERTLLHFPEVVERAAAELEPHYVTTYLTELAGAFNSWYASTRVIGGDYPSYGLLLATAVEQTLKKGLQVLGIPAPEEM